jgi:hypothetical protein
VFENRVLRRIFGPKRDEVTGGWREVHYEELLNLYSFPSIIRMIKSRRMRWARHITQMGGEEECIYKYLVSSAFTSRPTSLLEAINVCVFFFMVSMLSPNIFTA